MNGPHGFELVLDLHERDVRRFNRLSLNSFFTGLCDVIEMHRCEVYFWDDEGGASVEQVRISLGYSFDNFSMAVASSLPAPSAGAAILVPAVRPNGRRTDSGSIPAFIAEITPAASQ